MTVDAAPRPPRRRLWIFLALAAGLASFFLLGLNEYLSLLTIKEQHAVLANEFARKPTPFILGFSLLCTLALALSIPGAVLSLSLAAGAIFGLRLGTAIICVSTIAGSSIAFLAARYIGRQWVKERFARYMAALDRGMEADGAFYLLALRLMAVVPYFVINLGMALTGIRWKTFAAVSLAGIVPSTFLYVNAGTQLAKISRPSDILSPQLVGSFVLLGLLPIAARYSFARLRRPTRR